MQCCSAAVQACGEMCSKLFFGSKNSFGKKDDDGWDGDQSRFWSPAEANMYGRANGGSRGMPVLPRGSHNYHPGHGHVAIAAGSSAMHAQAVGNRAHRDGQQQWQAYPYAQQADYQIKKSTEDAPRIFNNGNPAVQVSEMQVDASGKQRSQEAPGTKMEQMAPTAHKKKPAIFGPPIVALSSPILGLPDVIPLPINLPLHPKRGGEHGISKQTLPMKAPVGHLSKVEESSGMVCKPNAQQDVSAPQGQSARNVAMIGCAPIAKKISWNSLVMGDVIGQGAFGTVSCAHLNGKTVALKVMSCRPTPATMQEFDGEIKVLAGLKHERIVELLGVTMDEMNKPGIVIEWVDGGSLWDCIHDPQVQWSWQDVLRMAIDIADALSYLHDFKPPIVHRDIKSGNLLYSRSQNCVKLADFGLSRVVAVNQTMTGQRGTFQWMAPEVLTSMRYSQAADVFSFGVVLWELCARDVPYRGMEGMQAALAVVSSGLRPEIPEYVPESLRAIISSCWSQKAQDRPSMTDVAGWLREQLQ